MDKVFATITAFLLIGLILWWFFGKRGEDEAAAVVKDNRQSAEITVDGGYMPNTVTLQKGVPATLVFHRKDPSACLEEVVFPDFGIHEKLPVNGRHEIKLDTTKAGEFKYACGMHMFFGKVVIK